MSHFILRMSAANEQNNNPRVTKVYEVTLQPDDTYCNLIFFNNILGERSFLFIRGIIFTMVGENFEFQLFEMLQNTEFKQFY